MLFVFGRGHELVFVRKPGVSQTHTPICTVYDSIFSDVPAKYTAYVPYIYRVVQFEVRPKV